MHLCNVDAQSVLQVTLLDLHVAPSAKFLLNECRLVISFPLHGGEPQPAACDEKSQHSPQATDPVLPAQVPVVDGNWKR